MTEVLLDHLWQSTLVACAAALLTLAFRNNAASIRFRILLLASLKFLLPFPLLILLGVHLHGNATPAVGAWGATPQWSLVASRVMQPPSLAAALVAAEVAATGGPATVTPATGAPRVSHGPASSWSWHWGLGTWLLLAWPLGTVVLLGHWLLQWLKLRAIAAAAVPLEIEAPIPVRETRSTLEPGIFGIFAPVLLLPQGISTRLDPTELDSVLEHELCHWWRRDNLTGVLHMLVAALFWFHPLVWWLGGRLVIERERACDEEVIESGTARQVYADAILKVCRFYLEPALLCAAGVSGGTLRQRIEDIMTNQVGSRLHLAKKLLLSAAAALAIAGPVAIGLALGPQGLAQAQETGGTQHYQNTEWDFSLDVPGGWNRFPVNLSESPREVVRFGGSGQSGKQMLIVFRNFFDTQKGLGAYITMDEKALEKKGCAHFVTGATHLGARNVTTLDFDKVEADGSIWSTHQYMFTQGSLLYTLSFGTNSQQPAVLIAGEDRVASSFAFSGSVQAAAGASSTFTMSAPAASGSRHYQSTEWKFGLDVPQGWNRFAPVAANSPSEVVRFGTGENGYQLLIVFRYNFNTEVGLAAHIAGIEAVLGKMGFANFVTGQVTLGSSQVTTLEFNRTNADGSVWSCRQYFFIDNSLMYVLGFGTSAKPASVLAQQDSIAQSFTFDPST